MKNPLTMSLVISASALLLSGCLGDLPPFGYTEDPFDISIYNEDKALNEDFEGAWILVSKTLRFDTMQTGNVYARRVCTFQKIDTTQYSSSCFRDQIDSLFTASSNQLVNNSGTIVIEASTFTRASGSVDFSISDNEFIRYSFEMKKIGEIGSSIGTQSLNQDIANTVEFRQEYQPEYDMENQLLFIDENANTIDLSHTDIIASSVSGTYDPGEMEGVTEYGYEGTLDSKFYLYDYSILTNTGNDVNGTIDVRFP